MLLVLIGVAAAVVAVVAIGGVGGPAVTPSAGSAPSGEAATVVHVTDGDTIVVQLDGVRERVRYVGVDAPELPNVETGRPAECGAEAARAMNADLVDTAEVVLVRDVTDRDRFGRLLRHVWIGGDGAWRLVSEELVAAGAVEARSYPPDTGFDGRLDATERRARDEGRGIWGSC